MCTGGCGDPEPLVDPCRRGCTGLHRLFRDSLQAVGAGQGAKALWEMRVRGQNLSAVLAAAGLDSAAQKIVPGRDGLRGVEVHDNEPGYRGRYYLRGYA